ncbi:MAG: sodium-translocating pyrophosphatase [SAR324 cluster bacterium]|uniref:Putative K(+)-stimulated pyrophosphate-energized sodium pump n=1 Tax=SAR324 cluster bacterium TaxID=2024889 RepID=A0A432G4R6_9DELT|nr:MAG: sodium-translocating pyrophosphatase [SAR324 cluster bacterium]
MITVIIASAFFGLGVALFYYLKVSRIPLTQGIDNPEEASKLIKIHGAIATGAMAFLKAEYKYMVYFMAGFALLIAFLIDDPHTADTNEGIYTAISFLLGCVISIISGFIGMRIATIGNARTTTAAKSSIAEAFKVALNSGAVMGFGLVGLGVLGLIGIYLLLKFLLPEIEPHILMEVLAGFGLGGSSIALFGRVSGGIFTKAADVGADLVGKVEQGIPEDDPRNPAVIADNVGDNVGDVAGMGADLFGSLAESTCAALVIGAVAFATNLEALLFPILISAVGIPASLLTMFSARVSEEKDVAPVLKRLLIISTVLSAIAVFFVTMWALPESFEIGGQLYTNMGIYFCFLSGSIAGLLVGLLTEYYTSHDFKPVREVAKASETGAATNIIFGLALGYHSATGSILLLAASIYASFTLGGMYGVAVAALGMLSTLVVGLTIDAYGPVADNAGGIAEMTGMGESVRDRTDVLDAAGNTTAAIGKGFAIGSAILTSLALFSAFLTRADLLDPQAKIMDSINLLDPLVLTGLFVGAMLPFLFSAMTMKSVGKAAFDMIEEVRRQFRTIPGIMEGTAEPDYEKCVSISTEAALREMIPPGILIMGTPLLVGFLFGVPAVAGILAGSLVSGGVLAISSANSGGAWDNAKKYIEKGNLGGKGTETHKAAVVGDTVGDPLKDTSGPALNILIKLSAILSLVFVPFFIQYGGLLIG